MAKIETYETASGATLYMVSYRKPDNKQTMKRGFKTKRDAQQWANKVEVNKMTGEYVAPSLGRATVGMLGPAWLDRQRGHMKPSGFRSYESAWRIHVAPRWGATQIADIRYSDVQASRQFVSSWSTWPGRYSHPRSTSAPGRGPTAPKVCATRCASMSVNRTAPGANPAPIRNAPGSQGLPRADSRRSAQGVARRAGLHDGRSRH